MREACGRALAGVLACAALVSACGDDGGGGGATTQDFDTPEDLSGPIKRNAENGDVTITVGSKNFTEQKVLGEIFAQGLEAAGYRVRRRFSLGDEQAAQKALQDRVVDGYPEYTGTALLSLCGTSTDEIPKDPQQAYEDAASCLADKGETAYPPTPFTSSNEVGVTAATAKRYKLRRISDLMPIAREFTLHGTKECRQRADCLAGLQKVYGLRFKQFVETPIDRRHAVLQGDGPNASIVFTTDPQNRREGIVLLEDDRGMFPPYNSTFVVRNDIADRAGKDLGDTVQRIEQGLTDEAMQELNARVDLDRETPAKVATSYLRDSRLIAAG